MANWFPRPPIAVLDAEQLGVIRHINTVEGAGRELMKWPNTPKRDKAALIIADALEGKATAEEAKAAFEAAAKEAKYWAPYRGPPER